MRARLALLVAGVVLVVPAPALAGRLIVTGHDADRRCVQLGQQCSFLKAALKYVRETAPAASKPILVLDRGPKQLAASIRKAWGGSSYAEVAATAPPMRIVDPRSSAFARLAISTKRFSAVAIASDASCGGCDLEAADAAAIAKRTRVLQKFMNAGGGIYAGAGGVNATAYYSFMPIPAPGPPSDGPFELTPYGKRIGFKLADVTCCAVANTFTEPDVGALATAAQTSTKVSDTLISDGVVRNGRLVATTTIPAETGDSFIVQPVSGTVLGHPPDDPNFRRITGAANLVMGWTLNVTQGRARLTTEGTRRTPQSVDAFEGFFTILQGQSSPVTDLVLRSGDFDQVCGSGGVDIARASASTQSVRHLWASGKGKFRTTGRFASASIRGTEWLTEDRCDGTQITVKTGAVSVFDKTLNKSVVVTPANSPYLAKAP